MNLLKYQNVSWSTISVVAKLISLVIKIYPSPSSGIDNVFVNGHSSIPGKCTWNSIDSVRPEEELKCQFANECG